MYGNLVTGPLWTSGFEARFVSVGLHMFDRSTSEVGRPVAAGQQNKPTWQTDVCPSWCARVHYDDDHPEDRIHRSAPLTVPALRRRSLLPEDQPERTQIEVLMAARMDGRASRWILASEGEGPTFFILDEVSTLSLIGSLQALLE